MSTETKVEGKAIVVGETETFGSNGFRKRTLVVETEDQYPQQVPIDFIQDNVDKLDSINEGDKVSVSINIRGRENNGKYYSSLNGWKIVKESPTNEDF